MKPLDLIIDFAGRILTCPTRNRQPLPGEFISGLPSEQREILKDLKSDDFSKLRTDAIPSFIMIHNESYGRRMRGIVYDYAGRVVVRLENDGIQR